MHGNGVFRNFHGGCENFLAPTITENMHFITTKCIVTLKCMRDVLYSRIQCYTCISVLLWTVVLTLHCRPTHAEKIIQCLMCVYIAKLQL